MEATNTKGIKIQVNKAKVYVFLRLVNKMRVLKNRRIMPHQIEKNKQKISRIRQQIYYLKKRTPDELVKMTLEVGLSSGVAERPERREAMEIVLGQMLSKTKPMQNVLKCRLRSEFKDKGRKKTVKEVKTPVEKQTRLQVKTKPGKKRNRKPKTMITNEVTEDEECVRKYSNEDNDHVNAVSLDDDNNDDDDVNDAASISGDDCVNTVLLDDNHVTAVSSDDEVNDDDYANTGSSDDVSISDDRVNTVSSDDDVSISDEDHVNAGSLDDVSINDDDRMNSISMDDDVKVSDNEISQYRKFSRLESMFVGSMAEMAHRDMKRRNGKNKRDGNVKNRKNMKKNRMGQRERRKQWERQYGQEANHVKQGKRNCYNFGRQVDNQKNSLKGKLNKSGNAKGEAMYQKEAFHPSWESTRKKKPWIKRGQEANYTRQRKEHFNGRRRGDNQANPMKKEQNRAGRIKGVGMEHKSLHPSWEASRKRKLKETVFIPFEGKKIKFDD